MNQHNNEVPAVEQERVDKFRAMYAEVFTAPVQKLEELAKAQGVSVMVVVAGDENDLGTPVAGLFFSEAKKVPSCLVDLKRVVDGESVVVPAAIGAFIVELKKQSGEQAQPAESHEKIH